MKIGLLGFVFCVISSISGLAQDSEPSRRSVASDSINHLGLNLLRLSKEENIVISPYSIQSALAMAYEGAEGETRKQMETALRFPAHGVPQAFSALNLRLSDVAIRSSASQRTAITFWIANRVFAQKGYEFRKPFLDTLARDFRSPLEPIDFAKNPEEASKQINSWVAGQTRNQIQGLLPLGAIHSDVSIVLVNAIYLGCVSQSIT